jgi:hypothetical protein
MDFLQRFVSLFQPEQTIPPFQKQSRLWFVLRGRPIYVSPAEQDAKFFQACKEAFSPSRSIK